MFKMDKKKFFAILFLLCTPLFLQAQEENSSDSISGEIEQLRSAGKNALEVLENALGNATSFFEEKAKAFSSRACEGKWIFKNGNAQTQIECNADSSMTITQISRFSERNWKGTYSATLKEITFLAVEKSSKNAFVSSTEKIYETWKITFRALSNEMRIESKDIPNDANGYDFSQPTIFLTCQ